MKQLAALCLSIILIAIPTASHAEAIAPIAAPNAGTQKCSLVETVNFGVNFGNVILDLSSARSYVNDRIAEMQAMAKEVGIDELEINNMNYNLYSDSNNYTHAANTKAEPQLRLNGSVSFVITDAEKGTALMEKAISQGFNVNFSMNAYRRCN